MKYIYLKGLISNKKFIIMTLSLFVLLICLLFLCGYSNMVNDKIYDVEKEEENRTVYFYSSDFDISEYTNILENYTNYDNFYSLVFINYEESQKFIEDNHDKIDISEHVKGYNEKMLYLFRILKISSYILSILFFITINIFQIHYISSSNKVIKLYYILGLPIKKIIYIFNGLFSLFYIILSVIIYFITNYIKPNLLVIDNLFLIITIFVISLIITSIITNKLFLSSESRE